MVRTVLSIGYIFRISQIIYITVYDGTDIFGNIETIVHAQINRTIIWQLPGVNTGIRFIHPVLRIEVCIVLAEEVVVGRDFKSFERFLRSAQCGSELCGVTHMDIFQISVVCSDRIIRFIIHSEVNIIFPFPIA